MEFGIIVAILVAILVVAALTYINRDAVRGNLAADEKELEDYLAKQKATYEKWAKDEIAILEGKAKAEIDKVVK